MRLKNNDAVGLVKCPYFETNLIEVDKKCEAFRFGT